MLGHDDKDVVVTGGCIPRGAPDMLTLIRCKMFCFVSILLHVVHDMFLAILLTDGEAIFSNRFCDHTVESISYIQICCRHVDTRHPNGVCCRNVESISSNRIWCRDSMLINKAGLATPFHMGRPGESLLPRPC